MKFIRGPRHRPRGAGARSLRRPRSRRARALRFRRNPYEPHVLPRRPPRRRLRPPPRCPCRRGWPRAEWEDRRPPDHRLRDRRRQELPLRERPLRAPGHRRLRALRGQLRACRGGRPQRFGCARPFPASPPPPWRAPASQRRPGDGPPGPIAASPPGRSPPVRPRGPGRPRLAFAGFPPETSYDVPSLASVPRRRQLYFFAGSPAVSLTCFTLEATLVSPGRSRSALSPALPTLAASRRVSRLIPRVVRPVFS